MYFFREFGSFFRTVTQSQCSKHITFGSNTYTGTASLSTLLINLVPQYTFCMFHIFAFGVSINLFHDAFYLLQFQIDDIVHNALSQRYMFLEQFKVKVCIRFEGVYHIRIKIDSQQTAGVIRAQGNFTTWIGGNSAISQVCIAIGYGFF